jgi:hypothetical protein
VGVQSRRAGPGARGVAVGRQRPSLCSAGVGRDRGGARTSRRGEHEFEEARGEDEGGTMRSC